MFEEVADSPVRELFFIVALGEFLISLVDVASLDCFLLFVEFGYGLVQQFVVEGLLIEELGSVPIVGLFSGLLNGIFSDDCVCFCGCCFQPLDC